ncbi:hypothetical protein MPSEU_000408900 [Mayamaea pseudoterrestris]|nr:hypothetical protein MPSEU_000408900 [Mayamaea pseudoterrestris]
MMSHQDHPAYYYYHQETQYQQQQHQLQHHQQQAQQQQSHPPPPPASLHSDSSSHHHHHHQQEQHQQSQEEEVASFLLSLKHNHRSITPEPGSSSWSEKSLSPLIDYHQHHASASLSSIAQNRFLSTQALDIPVEQLVHQSNSMLVALQDIDLVPDALFLAMAQMVPTHMTYQDRVGCYKSREVGYLGMCCKHCGGQPGFGRFFPNSVRSLAQTTTSQTILKHIGSKCRHCPEDLKRAVAQLQRLQEQREAASGRPRYGSRKVFFQRVWDRLHKLDREARSVGHHRLHHGLVMAASEHSEASSAEDAKYDDASSSQTPSEADDDQTLEAWPSHDAEESAVRKIKSELP